jgi:hypothetical protein
MTSKKRLKRHTDIHTPHTQILPTLPHIPLIFPHIQPTPPRGDSEIRSGTKGFNRNAGHWVKVGLAQGISFGY